VSSARSKPGLEEIVKQSHNVLQAEGPEKQQEYLRNRSIAIGRKSATYTMPTAEGSSDEPSTQLLTENEISLNFSVYTDCISYSHTWSNVNITGVGVSYPGGVSVSVSNENNEWNKGRDDDGNFLRLSYDELTGC